MKLLLYHFTTSITKHICQLSEACICKIRSAIISCKIMSSGGSVGRALESLSRGHEFNAIHAVQVEIMAYKNLTYISTHVLLLLFLYHLNNSYVMTLIIIPKHNYVLTEFLALQQWTSKLRIITTPFNNDHWQSIIITLPHALFKKRSALSRLINLQGYYYRSTVKV